MGIRKCTDPYGGNSRDRGSEVFEAVIFLLMLASIVAVSLKEC